MRLFLDLVLIIKYFQLYLKSWLNASWGGTCNKQVDEWMKSHLFVTWEIIQVTKYCFEIFKQAIFINLNFSQLKVYAV